MNGAWRFQLTSVLAIVGVSWTSPVFAGQQTMEDFQEREATAGWEGTIVAQVGNYAEISQRAHVRSHSPAIVALIQRATQQSQTFRALIETINASDGIVFVKEGTCRQSVRACLVTVMEAGPNRLLRVRVDTQKADRDLMGSIGHELRHPIEVLNETGVRSNHDMYFFYQRISPRILGSHRSDNVFETRTALETGAAVREELGEYAERMATKGK